MNMGETGGIGSIVINGWRMYATGIQMRGGDFLITATANDVAFEAGRYPYVLLGADSVPVFRGMAEVPTVRQGDVADVEVKLTPTPRHSVLRN
jgi:hypothetical protein